MTLADRLPPDADPDALFTAFNDWCAEQGIELYPAQEEALIEVVTGANVIPFGYGALWVVYLGLGGAVWWLLRRFSRVPLDSSEGLEVDDHAG